MDHPIRVAFCPLLYAANGGTFDVRGKPLFVEGIVGKCNDPYDCANCTYLKQWVDSRAVNLQIANWECVYCISSKDGEDRLLPGFYQSGVCHICGYETSFLQLVIRDRKPRGVLPAT